MRVSSHLLKKLQLHVHLTCIFILHSTAWYLTFPFLYSVNFNEKGIGYPFNEEEEEEGSCKMNSILLKIG